MTSQSKQGSWPSQGYARWQSDAGGSLLVVVKVEESYSCPNRIFGRINLFFPWLILYSPTYFTGDFFLSECYLAK